MTRAEMWKKFYEQQERIRNMIKEGIGDTDEFWNQHRIMEQLRVRACNPNNF